MKCYANARMPSGVFYPVTRNKYFSNKTPCTRLEMYVALCPEAKLLVELKPHKCRQMKRSFMYFLHIFEIFWWKLHTNWSLKGTLSQKSSLTDSGVTSSGGTSLVIPSEIALCPCHSVHHLTLLYFFSTFITILCSLFILVPLCVCLFDFSRWNVTTMEEENWSVLFIVIPQCQGQCFPQSRRSINFCWMTQRKNGY